MKPLEPIYVTDLFPKLDARLSELLRGLSDEDWRKPTVAPLWTVKDIAAHLLDTNLRRLSMQRDGYFGEKPENISSYQDLVDFLNRLNADWVKAAKRVSPRILIDLLEITNREVNALLASLDPYGPAIYSVAWAGEEASENWFDVAREYTEKWHHQQQIRLAVGKPGILERELYHPVLDAFLRALPHTYRDVDAPEGTLLRFDVAGEAGGSWFLSRQDRSWRLAREAEGTVHSEVTIPQEIAWRLFTKGIARELARREIRVTGEPQDLGWKVLDTLSVMA
ncbi:MAG TPA: maleylpyruvate isomerase family mycothiol-dependent enzyme [Thermoanaerobaculia bacterium]